MGQGEPLDRVGRGALFGRHGFEELEPRRRIEKQVAHFDPGAGRHRTLRNPLDLAADRDNLDTVVVDRSPRPQHHSRDARDRRERLATKAQRVNRSQIRRVANLGGGVAAQRQNGVLPAHSAAVIRNHQQRSAAALDFYRNRPRSGVERVLDQLFERGRRALDHLARRNLAGHLLGQYMDDPIAHLAVFVRAPRRLARTARLPRHAHRSAQRCVPRCEPGCEHCPLQWGLEGANSSCAGPPAPSESRFTNNARRSLLIATVAALVPALTLIRPLLFPQRTR